MSLRNIHRMHIDYALVLLVVIGIILAALGYPHLLNLTVLVYIAFIFYRGTFKSEHSLNENKDELSDNDDPDDEKEDHSDDSWELKKITPQIFVLSFGNKYDLGMHFLRYQEYYESPNPKYRKHIFTLVDFMDWYSKDRDGYFSYPDDWSGYNVPGWVFKEVLEESYIHDWNKYDQFMHERVEEIQKQLPPGEDPWNFYLIGIKKGDEETIDHELAHGLYYSIPAYKQKMDAVASKYKDVQNCFNEHLVDLGYDETVFIDEFQAYFSTGILDEGKEHLRSSGKEYEEAVEECEAIFHKFKKEKTIVA